MDLPADGSMDLWIYGSMDLTDLTDLTDLMILCISTKGTDLTDLTDLMHLTGLMDSGGDPWPCEE